MTKAWRLVKTRHTETAFSGVGARLAGGRWNQPGTAVVYVSDTLSLAVLELFVHLDARSRTGLRLVSIPVGIPDDLVAQPPALPTGWRVSPPGPASMAIGTDWVRAARSCVLRVPSVLVPHEPNYVLNPAHPDFHRLEIGDPEPFGLDPRLWK